MSATASVVVEEQMAIVHFSPENKYPSKAKARDYVCKHRMSYVRSDGNFNFHLVWPLQKVKDAGGKIVAIKSEEKNNFLKKSSELYCLNIDTVCTGTTIDVQNDQKPKWKLDMSCKETVLTQELNDRFKQGDRPKRKIAIAKGVARGTVYDKTAISYPTWKINAFDNVKQFQIVSCDSHNISLNTLTCMPISNEGGVLPFLVKIDKRDVDLVRYREPEVVETDMLDKCLSHFTLYLTNKEFKLQQQQAQRTSPSIPTTSSTPRTFSFGSIHL